LRGELEATFRADALAAQLDGDAPRWERLDTPAFFEEDVDNLVASIRDTARTKVPVVIAHHNLLPQALPRISPYAELLNGGMLRERLGGLDQPVLYLHGHIHSSPVEVVLTPSAPRARLIIVAAPLFVEGFNRLAFEFTADGVPLGVEVTPSRVQRSGGFQPRAVIRVPLVAPYDSAHSESVDSVVAVVKGASAHMRYREVKRTVRVNGRHLSDSHLQDALREAEWLGWVNLINREYEPASWQIEGAGR
jgi:hypothetical protein